jgi:hypothetical protein
MAAQGLRAFSGLTIGVGGSIVGIHWSLALSASALLIAASFLFVMTRPALARATSAD